MEEEIEDAMVYDGKENGRRWKIRRKIMEEEIGGDLCWANSLEAAGRLQGRPEIQAPVWKFHNNCKNIEY